MAGFDAARVSSTVAAALRGPGGIASVITVFGAVPGVVHSPARRRFLRAAPEQVHIGDWRYEVSPDGRLSAAHVVNQVVIAEELLDAAAVGPHIARALGQVVDRYGSDVCPHINAAVEALSVGLGGT